MAVDSRTGVQRDVLLAAGGQPGDRAVWAGAGGFFVDTRRTVEAAYLRPRAAWWPDFQRAGGRLLVRLLRDGATARAVVEELTGLAARTEERSR